jgi:DHA2 family multidrug resistance protein
MVDAAPSTPPASPQGPGAGAPPGPPPLHGGTLVLFTLSMALATFMEVLDLTIVNVAVPTIAGSLGVSANQGTWAISSYSVASAIAVPLTGWLARRLGEVRLFLISVSLFVAMSMLCGLATSLPMLAALRALQGLVSGPMVPLSQSLLLGNYPPQKRGLAMALWAMTIVVAPILGPMMGGWISDNLSWPWVFYINAPIGILSVIINFSLLRGRETPTVKVPIDVIGLVLLVVGVGSLQLMLDNGRDLDWFGSNLIVALAVTATVCLTFLVAWELTDRHPIVDLTLFARRNFRVGASLLSLGYMTFFASVVVFPLWLQTVMGYTATQAGLAVAPVGILSLVLSPIIGRNIARLDLRYVTTIAFIVFAGVSFWSATFTLTSTFAQVSLPRFVQGIAVACFFVPLNTMLLSGLPANRIAAAAGLSNFLRTLGGAIGTAVSVTVWDHRADYHHTVLAEHVNNFNPAAADYFDKVNGMGLMNDQTNHFVDQVVSAQSIMLATSDVFWVSGVIFLCLMGVVWFTRPPYVTTGGPGGH